MLRRVSFAVAVGLLLATPYGARAEDLTLEQIIDKYIKAHGGRDKIDAIQSVRVTGKQKMSGGMDIEVPVVMEQQRPNKFRVDFTFQGLTGTRAFDGKTGWSIMPFQGKTDAEKMSEDDVKEVEDEADLAGPLIDSQAKGHKVELVGKEDAEGEQAYKVKVTKKNGNIEYHFVDAEQFLTIKSSGVRKVQGSEMEYEAIYGDYKSVDGWLMPHTLEQRAMGMKMMFVFDKVETNVKLPADRFTMPEPKKEQPKKEEPKKEGEKKDPGK